MADLISIIMIIIFGFFTVKKLILPRIMAKRAAKNGVVISSQPIPDGMQEAIAKTNRPLTGLGGVQLINLSLFDGETDTEALETRIRQTASEMLLNASLSGRDVRLNMSYAHPVLILYVTYTT